VGARFSLVERIVIRYRRAGLTGSRGNAGNGFVRRRALAAWLPIDTPDDRYAAERRLRIKHGMTLLVVLVAVTVLVAAASAASLSIVNSGISDGATISGSVSWSAVVSNGVPNRVVFSIDGTSRWTENYSPYTFNGDGNKLDTTTLTDGSHTLTATAYPTAGSTTGAVSATSTVNVSNHSAALAAPTGLNVSDQGGAWFVMRWTGVSGATGYRAYLNGQLDGTVSYNAYNFQHLACGTTYTLGVAAYTSSASSPIATMTATTNACGGGTTTTTTPSPPASNPGAGNVFWSAASFLNTPLPSFTLDSSSSRWLGMLTGSTSYGLYVDSLSWTAPIYHATSSTPTASIAVANSGKHISIPYLSNFKPDPSGDSQIAVINDSNGCEYEFQAFNAGSRSANSEATFHISTGTGIHANDAGVTGSNISILGGLITAKDVASGAINHALRYATPFDSPGYVAPASRSNGGTSGGIPAGQLMRLDPSLDVSSMGLTPFQLMVAKALQKYGAYNADASGTFKLYAESTVDGATYSATPSALPWSVASHLQFGKTAFGSSAVNVDTNSDPSCNQQH
jgi:hypothetical protein